MGPRPDGVVLIGMRRAGKSTAGALLARRLAVPFVDLDDRIELCEGRPPGLIISAEGLGAFRRIESRVLKGAAETPGCVLATGGGTPLRRCNRRRLRSYGRVVFIDVALEALLARAAGCAGRDGRPLLGGARSAVEEVEIHWAERRPYYLECAHAVVEGAELPGETVARILAALSV